MTNEFREEYRLYKILSPAGRLKLRKQLKTLGRPPGVRIDIAFQFALITFCTTIVLSYIHFPAWVAAITGYITGFYWLSIQYNFTKWSA